MKLLAGCDLVRGREFRFPHLKMYSSYASSGTGAGQGRVWKPSYFISKRDAATKLLCSENIKIGFYAFFGECIFYAYA